MGILNRVIGTARRSATSAGAARGRRGTARGRTSGTSSSGTRGLGGMAQRLLGGRRRGGL